MIDDDNDDRAPNPADALAAEIAANELNRSLQAVLASGEGKRVIFWLFAECSIETDPFAGPGLAEATAYRLGQQSIGRRIISKLEQLDPRLYPTLLFDMATIRAKDRALAEERLRSHDQTESEEDDYA